MVVFWDKFLVRNVDLLLSVSASEMCGITFRLSTVRWTECRQFCGLLHVKYVFHRQGSYCLLVGRECCIITVT